MSKYPSHLYGESIFTTTRSIDGNVIFIDQHVNRLLLQVSDYYFFGRITVAELARYFEVEKKINEFAQKNKNCILRGTFFARERSNLLPTRFAISDLVFEVSSREFSAPVSKKLTVTPSPYSAYKSQLKAGSYFQNFYFRRLAIKDGFDDVLFERDGNLSEASTSNLVFEKNGEFTTPEDQSVFYGLGLEILSAAGVKIQKRRIMLAELNSFNSCYLVNSVHLLTPVTEIDGLAFTNSSHETMLSMVEQFLRSKI